MHLSIVWPTLTPLDKGVPHTNVTYNMRQCIRCTHIWPILNPPNECSVDWHVTHIWLAKWGFVYAFDPNVTGIWPTKWHSAMDSHELRGMRAFNVDRFTLTVQWSHSLVNFYKESLCKSEFFWQGLFVSIPKACCGMYVGMCHTVDRCMKLYKSTRGVWLPSNPWKSVSSACTNCRANKLYNYLCKHV